MGVQYAKNMGFEELSETPSHPSAGNRRVYFKDDGRMYQLAAEGSEREIGSGGGGITDMTYADLVTAIGNETLVKGSYYRITDFATKHYIVDGDGNTFVQKDRLTPTGTSGTTTISGAGGLSRIMTFDTNIKTTITNFINDNYEDYFTQGIKLRGIGAEGNYYAIDFIGVSPSVEFTHPVITNNTGDLDGSILNIQAGDGEITGGNEPLIVFAIASDAISPIAKSEQYPQDIIYYDWNPTNWMDDLSFADVENYPVTIISGFKGVIYFRHDTLLDNYCGYDFRNVKFRRWKTDAAAWNSETTYSKGDFCTSDGKIYISMADANLNNDVLNTSFWTVYIDLVDSEYWFATPQGSAEYADLLTFNPSVTDYDTTCKSNHLNGYKDDYSGWWVNGTLLSNNVFHLNSNAGVTASNVIGSGFNVNTVGANFFGNSIGGAASYGNILGRSFNLNIVGHNFRYNVIGEGFGLNTIGSGVNSIIAGGYFMYNTIENDFSDVNFLSANHVYITHNCTLYKRPDGVCKLRYYDNSDQLVVVNANA